MFCRILILHGTGEGRAATMAARMANTLCGMGADVDVLKAPESGIGPYPEDYAAVIVAASMHGRGYQRQVRRWVHHHAPALDDRPTAFVSLCETPLRESPEIDRQRREIMRRFYKETGWFPTESNVVADDRDDLAAFARRFARVCHVVDEETFAAGAG